MSDAAMKDEMSPRVATLGPLLLLSIATLVGCADETSSGSTGTYVHPGSEELTERQAEMLDVLDQYLDAWRARDGELAASYMTEDAVFEYYELEDLYFVADGSLQARITAGPYNTLRDFEPVMVYDNRIALTGSVDAAGIRWLSVIRFSRSGGVKIVKETVFFGG